MTPERIAELRSWCAAPEEDVLVIYQHALATIPELLDEIERLQAEVDRLGEALTACEATECPDCAEGLAPQWQADGDIGRFQHVLVAVRAATGDPGPFVQEADAGDISDLLSDGYVIYAWAPMVDPPDPKRFP